MNEIINERVNLITEYIEQILNDNNVHATMNLDINKINDNEFITLDIEVKERNFERHFNLGIPLNNETDFYKLLLNTFIDKYIDSETIGIEKYRDFFGFVGDSFHGINLSGINGSKIAFSFMPRKEESRVLIDEYNNKIKLSMEEKGIKSTSIYDSLRVK